MFGKSKKFDLILYEKLYNKTTFTYKYLSMYTNMPVWNNI